MTIDLDSLETAAEAATQGPWDYGGNEVFLKGTDFWPIIANCRKEDDTAFIAAANPAVVLELIAELRKARAERDWLTEQIGGNLPCPPYSDVIDEADCDNECCEECWLKAASKAVEES